MANPEHVAQLKKGVDAWNQWRWENSETKPNLYKVRLIRVDLSGANLSGADLNEAILGGANLSFANLSNADLSNANLSFADLRNANLNDASLTRTNLRMANLSDANLTMANFTMANLDYAGLTNANLTRTNLISTNFLNADLSGANLHEARLQNTVLANLDLSGTIGLKSCRHLGPSTIDHLTLARSGRLPVAFLRGCGLPDALIMYLPSIFTQGMEFYSCFISYSTKDQDFADRLYADLQNKGVRCWFAPHDIQGGKKIHEQIDSAIQMHDRLLLILSEASMDSEWVNTEIAKARMRELREKRRMLFPIRLVSFEALRYWECFDADMGKDSAREIREYFVPDFSNWENHDQYQKAFEHLLRDLKAEERREEPPG
jgi:TIR domain/Pentapeptide repeats (8 copies)